MLVAAAALLWATHRTPAAILHLADGTTLEIRSVAVGRRHPDPFAPAWQRVTAKLPRTWRLFGRLPRAAVFESGEDALSVWMSSDHPPLTSSESRAAYLVTLEDEAGGSSEGEMQTAGPLPNRRWRELHLYNVWPRRGDWLRIQVRQLQGGEILAECRVRNPQPAAAPLRPDPEAFVRTNIGDVSVELLGLGVNDFGASRAGWPEGVGARHTVEVRFRLSRRGEPATDLFPCSVASLSDATGNRRSGRVASVLRRGGRNGDVWFDSGLAPLPMGEPWQAVVVFENMDGPLAGERWQTTPGGLVAALSDQGCKLTNSLPGGLEAITQLLHRPWRDAATFDVCVEVSPAAANRAPCLIRAVDDQGREAAVRAGPVNDARRFFLLTTKPGAQAVQLSLCYSHLSPVTVAAMPQRWASGSVSEAHTPPLP